MNEQFDLEELEADLEKAKKRIEDLDNDLTWATTYAREQPCKTHFAAMRAAKQKLEAAREFYDDLWQQYQDAYAWENQMP